MSQELHLSPQRPDNCVCILEHDGTGYELICTDCLRGIRSLYWETLAHSAPPKKADTE